jgi:hypothetical protein
MKPSQSLKVRFAVARGIEFIMSGMKIMAPLNPSGLRKRPSKNENTVNYMIF